MKIPPRLWRMLLTYLVGPLLQALGGGLAGLVRRLLGREPDPDPEAPETQPPKTSPRRRKRTREPPGGE